jgi:protein associated with RNAse G/E
MDEPNSLRLGASASPAQAGPGRTRRRLLVGPGDQVHVDITKFDGTPHRGYPAILLGSDDYGRWLGVPAGTVSDSGTRHERPWVLLVPEDAWWTAMFNPPPQGSEVYCDITTPAEWIADRVILADLDLDVKRRRASGAVLLVDADEFDQHAERFAYPAQLMDKAWEAAFSLQRALGDGSEPFASHYLRWLDKIVSWTA